MPPNAHTNPDDWAVIVGIASYPGFQDHDLPGALNDATRFHDWVVSPMGGGIPPAQAKLVLSPTPTTTPAEPTQAQIEKELLALDDLALRNNAAGNGYRVGRRLYLFFSGHGFAPTSDETAFLAADASPQRVGFHIPGRIWANTFSLAGYFDEVVLFMDCCRESFPLAPLRPPPLTPRNDGTAIQNRRWFYGFATKWTMAAKESMFTVNGDSIPHGVFTYALLQALWGNAANAAGRVTGQSLSSWLYNNMSIFLTPEQKNDPDVPKEPLIDTEVGAADSFIFAFVPPKTFEVEVVPAPTRMGKHLQVDTGEDSPIRAEVAAAPARWPIALERGLYRVRSPGDGHSAYFEVKGAGEGVVVHV